MFYEKAFYIKHWIKITNRKINLVMLIHATGGPEMLTMIIHLHQNRQPLINYINYSV